MTIKSAEWPDGWSPVCSRSLPLSFIGLLLSWSLTRCRRCRRAWWTSPGTPAVSALDTKRTLEHRVRPPDARSDPGRVGSDLVTVHERARTRNAQRPRHHVRTPYRQRRHGGAVSGSGFPARTPNRTPGVAVVRSPVRGRQVAQVAGSTGHPVTYGTKPTNMVAWSDSRTNFLSAGHQDHPPPGPFHGRAGGRGWPSASGCAWQGGDPKRVSMALRSVSGMPAHHNLGQRKAPAPRRALRRSLSTPRRGHAPRPL